MAWRAWMLWYRRRAAEPVLLRPIVGSTRPWPPAEPARATCVRPKLHRAPFPHCTCGLYATRSEELLRRTRNPAVVGTVALWGRVIEHELGYRAEYAYPQRLQLVCYLCFFTWGVHGTHPTVAVQPARGQLTPLCPEHLDLSARYGFPTQRWMPADEVEGALLAAYRVDLLRR